MTTSNPLALGIFILSGFSGVTIGCRGWTASEPGKDHEPELQEIIHNLDAEDWASHRAARILLARLSLDP